MKIDRAKIKKAPYELPFESKVLISKLMSCTDDNQLTVVLTSIVNWEYGMSEIYHWSDVLDKFDTVLEECCTRNGPNLWSTLTVDLPFNTKKKELVMAIMAFFSHLAQNTYGSIFNSTEHLTTLLWSVDIKIVTKVLFTMYIFADESFFETYANDNVRNHVLTVAKSWGGKESGVSLVQCMKEDYTPLLTTFYFECSSYDKDDYKHQDGHILIKIDKSQLVNKHIDAIMTELIELHHVPTECHFELFNRIRLIQCFDQHSARLEYICARTYALAFVACWRDDTTAFYSGLEKELVETLSVTHIDKYHLTKIQVAVINTLSALIAFEDGSREKAIIMATNISSPHGPLSMLVRNTIHELTSTSDYDPSYFHESLIWLLLVIASNETGLQAIVRSGLLDSLLQLVKWEGPSEEHLGIVRYALKVASKWINLNHNYLRTCDGINIIAKRLECEVEYCLLMLPDSVFNQPYHSVARLDTICWALYILRKCIKYPLFTDLLRRLLNGSNFPQILKNILRHGRFYVGSLFAEALEFVAEYIHQNPFNLSSLQNNGFSDLIFNTLLDMNIPINVEVATAIPGAFEALCINSRGMESFLALKPFERLFALFTSVSFLREIRKQRKESASETAVKFGSTMAILVRHHPNLRPFAVNAMIGLMNEICRLGTEPKYICSAKFELSEDEPDDYEDHRIVSQVWITVNKEVMMTALSTLNGEYRINLTERRIRIPLHEYIKNSTKFINEYLRSSSAESSTEFLRAGGLDSLLNLLNLPNASPTEHLVAISSDIFTIWHDSVQNQTVDNLNIVLSACLSKFNCHLAHLNSLMNQMNCSTGSAILEDLFLCFSSDLDFHQAPILTTPTLHALSVIANYLHVFSFSFVSDPKGKGVLFIQIWSSNVGLNVIYRLSKLYTTLLLEKLILNKFLVESIVEQPSNGQLQLISQTRRIPEANVHQYTQKIIDLIDQIDSLFKKVFSNLTELSYTLCYSDFGQHKSQRIIESALRKIIKHLFRSLSTMDCIDMRSEFCVSLIKVLMSLFDDNKANNRFLFHCDKISLDAFFELPAQMIGDIDTFRGHNLSNGIMDFLNYWLMLLELQTNDFYVNGSGFVAYSWKKTKRTRVPAVYVISVVNKVVKFVTKLWSIENARHLPKSTFSLLVNVTTNLFTSAGQSLVKDELKDKSYLLFELDVLAIKIQYDVLDILEDKPSMVCELARLLFTISQYNGMSLGIRGFIRGLIDKVTENVTSIVNLAQVVSSDDKEKIKLWASNPETIKLTKQVHLLAVLSAEMPFACAKEMLSDKKYYFMRKLYTLLELTVQLVSMAGDSITSMPQWLCPLILLIDQSEKNAIAYSQRQQLIQHSKRTWYIFNWSENVKLKRDNEFHQLDMAYQNGYPYYCGEHYCAFYMVHFGSMNLYCEETGKCEPIFIIIDLKQSNSQASQLASQCIEHQSHPHSDKSTIETMVTLLKLPLIDACTVEAISRICLRLTRNHSNACHFAQLGGITALLNFTTDLQFEGIEPMATLLIRHVYENEHVMRYSLNNEISSIFQSIECNKCPLRNYSLILQFLHSIACRDQTLTTQWLKSLLNSEGKICFCSNCVVPRQLKSEEQCEQSKELTREILNVLADRCASEKDTARPRREFVFTSTKLLAILAEMSCFCNPNNEVVVEHRYKQGHAEQITKDCSVFDFILDNMLHSTNSKELNLVIKFLIKFMSTSEPTFRKVFGQIDAALSRALASSDSADKHRKIESICSLIDQTIEDLTTLAPSLSSELFKMIEQCRLISTLARAIDWLDISSAYISTSVNASLKTIDYLIGFVNKMKSTNSVMVNNDDGSNGNSQQFVQTAPSLPMPNLTTHSNNDDEDDEDDEINEPRNEISSQCTGITVCPLMHPCLLSRKSQPASNPFKDILHYQNCRVALFAKENKFTLPNNQFNGSSSRGNSVVILHTLGCKCSNNMQVAPCSMCQWFMECCLVDGQFQYDAIDLVKLELIAHIQMIIEENERKAKEQEMNKVSEVVRQEARMLAQEFDNSANTNANFNQHDNSSTQEDDDNENNSSSPGTIDQTRSGRPVAQVCLSVPLNGSQFVETENISPLLLLLFVKKDLIDRVRFHSVIASFCSHQPTRKWMVYSLLHILEMANPITNPLMNDPTALKKAICSTPGKTSWESITFESTFGARLRVLPLVPATDSLCIHPQAADFVYSNVLDLFLVLTKTFPDFCLETNESSSSEQPASNASNSA